MKTLQALELATEQLIVATANTLKEAKEAGNSKMYRATQRMLMPLGELACSIDEVKEETPCTQN